MEWKYSPTPVPYPDALAFMEDYANKITKTHAPDLVWLLEHPPLFTQGFQSQEDHLINPTLPLFPTSRGGQLTYHGPGQRIAYVMMNLKNQGCDVKKYVFFLEEWIIQTLATLLIKGERRPGRIGVWVSTPQGEKKIAALGIRISQWVTSHGIALNVYNDLAPYNQIIPCGLKEFGITSLQELGIAISLEELDNILKKQLKLLIPSCF